MLKHNLLIRMLFGLLVQDRRWLLKKARCCWLNLIMCAASSTVFKTRFDLMKFLRIVSRNSIELSFESDRRNQLWMDVVVTTVSVVRLKNILRIWIDNLLPYLVALLSWFLLIY